LSSVRGVIKVLHPTNGIGSAIGVIAGYWITVRYLGFPFHVADVILAALSVFAVSSAGFVINDILDADIDNVNRPDRPIPSGQVSVTFAKGLYYLLVASSLILALPLGIEATVVVVLVNISLLVYSLWMKERLIIGHLIIALNGGILLLFGGIVAGSVVPTIYTVPALFCAFFAREVLKTIPDLEGDQAHDVHNITTQYGTQVASTVSRVGFALSFGLYILLSFIFDVPFFIVCIIIGLPLVIFFIPRIAPDRNLRTEIFISKMIFLIMIIPIVITV